MRLETLFPLLKKDVLLFAAVLETDLNIINNIAACHVGSLLCSGGKKVGVCQVLKE